MKTNEYKAELPNKKTNKVGIKVEKEHTRDPNSKRNSP